MIIRTQTGTFILRFFYSKFENRIKTECNLSPIDKAKEVIIAKGEACCDSRDRFEKAIGRKASLHKMLNEITLATQKEFGINKTDIIDEYRKQVKYYNYVEIPASVKEHNKQSEGYNV